MPRVICNLPNASEEISGVKFYPLDDGGLVSDEIGDELAASFLTIPGYESYDSPAAAPVPVKADPPAPRTRKAAPPPKKVLDPVKVPETVAQQDGPAEKSEGAQEAPQESTEATQEPKDGAQDSGDGGEVF